MATGQNHLIFTAYGEVTTRDNLTGGWVSFDYAKADYKSVPSVGTIFTAITPAQTIGGAVCNAVVEVLPSGLNVHGKKYATDSTIATLNGLAT